MSDLNSINVGNYSVFENAKAINNKYSNRFSEIATEVKECGDAMSDDVFMGPASDIIVEEIPVLEDVLSTYGVHLMGRLNKKLDKFAANYKNADKEASNSISNV